ncbi:hypothetical protein J437_LFUL014686, partial [Ladona fulva]
IVSEGINSSSKLFAIDEKQLQYFIDYAVKITEDCTLETVLFLYSKIMFCMSKYKDFCDSVKLIEVTAANIDVVSMVIKFHSLHTHLDCLDHTVGWYFEAFTE